MDKRMEDFLSNIENNSLGLDDTFNFKCRGCVKCCKNREDILLTARDLYNIAHYFGRTTEYVVERYCEVYIGKDSRMPIIRLKPSGPEKACPLLRDRKCSVHKSKPVVCALFPLGRAAAFSKTASGDGVPDSIQPRYFVQPAACGTKDRTYTVRSWLEMFGLPAEDEFYGLWTEAISFFAEFFRGMEALKVTERTMDLLWNVATYCLYINYDVEKDLISQFRENTANLRDALESARATAGIEFGGLPDGE